MGLADLATFIWDVVLLGGKTVGTGKVGSQPELEQQKGAVGR